MCSDTADLFLLYIPSKYEITVSTRADTYKLDNLDVPEDHDGNLVENYAGELDDFSLERLYEDIDVDLKTDDQQRKDIVGHLEEGYHVPVSMQNLSKEETMDIRNTFRQLRRLRFCVQGIKYKLAIIQESYLCCIHRDDTLVGFTIRDFPRLDVHTLMVTIDLETLISNTTGISTDIANVRQGVYNVLDRNQIRNARHLTRLVQHRNFNVPSQSAFQKKENYSNLIRKFERQLKSLLNPEISIRRRIAELQNLRVASVHQDIDRGHQLNSAFERLKEIQSVKQEITEHIVVLRRKQEELVLKTDRILFNLFVMTDTVSKLIEQLSKI